MAEDDPKFGALLRAARRQAGFSTIKLFADHLSEIGLTYTDEAMGHWENDRRKPDRSTTLRILGALAKRGGVSQLGQVNQMLEYLGLRNLDAAEQQTYFPDLLSGAEPANLPARPFDDVGGHPLRGIHGRDDPGGQAQQVSGS